MRRHRSGLQAAAQVCGDVVMDADTINESPAGSGTLGRWEKVAALLVFVSRATKRLVAMEEGSGRIVR